MLSHIDERDFSQKARQRPDKLLCQEWVKALTDKNLKASSPAIYPMRYIFSFLSVVIFLLTNSWAAPTISVSLETPKATYALGDTIPLTVTIQNTTRAATGEGAAVENKANTANFTITSASLSGTDIYGNSVKISVPVSDSPEPISPQADIDKVVNFTVPNDGTLHSDERYVFSIDYTFTYPDGTGGGSQNSAANVLINVVPDLALQRIEYKSGDYRGGDILQFKATVRNLSTGETGRQGRPLRPDTLDQVRFESRLTVAPAYGQDLPNEFRLFFADILGDQGGVPIGDIIDERSVVRRYAVVNTPRKITTFGRNYDPQPYDGFLDIGETLEITYEVRIPDNFPGIYFVAGQVDSLSTLPEPKDNVIPFKDTVDANGASVPVNNNTFVSKRATRIRILSSSYPTTELISGVVSDGTSPSRIGNNPSDLPSVSGAGEWVAFASFARNLLSGEQTANGRRHIFARQSLTGEINLVSANDAGRQGNANSYNPAISEDGRYVAFESEATNLVVNDLNGGSDIFVRDLVAGRTVRVSINDRGEQGSGASYNPSISGNGRFVAFESRARNLDIRRTLGNTAGTSLIYVHDRSVDGDLPYDRRDNTATYLVSVDARDVPANSFSYYARISNDAKEVAFVSYATNLPQGWRNKFEKVYRVSLVNGAPILRTVQLVSVNNAGVVANAPSYQPSINGDGNQIAFTSEADNLVANDANGVPDVFVRNIAEMVGKSIVRIGQTVRVSISNPRVASGVIMFYDPVAIRGTPPNNNPVRGTLFINDGSKAVRFTFGGNVDVGANGGETRDNLITAIRKSGLAVTVVPTTPPPAGVAEGKSAYSPGIFIQATNPGLKARWNVSATGVSNGSVQQINITNGGDGYTSAPSVSITGGGGSGAIAEATVLDGKVTSVRVTNGGAGYTSRPVIRFRGTSTQSASAVAELNSNVLLITDINKGGTEANDPENLPPGVASGSITPSIDASGRYVAFRSVADNMVVFEPTPENRSLAKGDLIRPQLGFFADVYIHDRKVNGRATTRFDRAGNVKTDIISVSTFGENTGALLNVQSSGNNQQPSISGDGRFIAFSSDAENTAGLLFGNSNLVPLDSNGFRDVYLRNRNIPGSRPLPPPTNLPVISIASPSEETTYVTGSNVIVAANVAPSPGKTIRQVEFIVNGTPLGAPLTSGPYLAQLPLNAPGTYNVTVVATDNFGISSSSIIRVVARAPVGQAPSISVTHPTSDLTAPSSVYSYSVASSFKLNALAVAGSGASLDFVKSVNITSGGSGYKTAPIVQLTGGGGKGAVAKAVVRDGKVTQVKIISGGSGYTSEPRVVFSGGGGRGASATAVNNKPLFFANGQPLLDKITGIRVGSNGSNYTSTPAVVISGGGGSGAEAIAIVANGEVDSIRLTNGGSGYTSQPIVRIIGGGGAGATAIAELSPSALRLGNEYGLDWSPDFINDYKITAQISDSLGNTVVSEALEIKIDSLTDSLAKITMRPPNFGVPPRVGNEVFLEASFSELLPTIERVDFYANDVFIGAWFADEDSTAPSGVAQITWIPSEAGTFKMSARVIQQDAPRTANSVISKPVLLKVDPQPQNVGLPPIILMSDPIADRRLTLGSSVYLNINATDPDGVLGDKSVKIYINGVEQDGLSRYGDAWAVAWTPADVGIYAVVATAQDSSGNVSIMSRQRFEIAAAVRSLPQVQLLPIPSGLQISTGVPIKLSASARFAGFPFDEQFVDFYINGVKIGTGALSGANYEYTWTPEFTGTARVSVKASERNWPSSFYGSSLSRNSTTFNVSGVPVNVVPGTPEAFVKELYPKLLYRDALFNEWKYYVDQLKGKRMSQADVVIALMGFNPRSGVFDSRSEYGRTVAMAFAPYSRLGLAPNLNALNAFFANLESNTDLLPLTSYPGVGGAPYGATLGLGQAMQEVINSPAFIRKYPTVQAMTEPQFVSWLRTTMFRNHILGNVTGLQSVSGGLMTNPNVRGFSQGSAAAFYSRFVLAAYTAPERTFQLQMNSTALRYQLSGRWTPSFGVKNPYSRAVVTNLLREFPVGGTRNAR